MSAALKSILLVEDDPRDREMTAKALARSRVSNELRIAADGEEALTVIESHADELCFVLLDLKLPKIDGLEVLARIRDEPATRTLPVVVLTSSREGPDITRAYELGANSYIVKPVQFEAFADAVKHIGLYWAVLNEPKEAT